MAVYTHLHKDEIQDLAEQFQLGLVIDALPIAEGVENSNYLLRTEGEGVPEKHILTLYEKRMKREDVPFFLHLKEHLAGKGLAVPRPRLTREGAMSAVVRGEKDAAIVSFLEGKAAEVIEPVHCAALGEAMAQLHEAVRDFGMRRENDLSLEGWQRLFGAIGEGAEKIEAGLADTISAELAYLESEWPEGLEGGVIHADLFPDNVFFEGAHLSGVIDFYFAANDFYLYDLAIAINAWCFSAEHRFECDNAAALLGAYRAARTLPEAEWAYLPLLARGAALRFLLTRSYDWLNRQEGAIVTVKGPLEYAAKLAFWQGVGTIAELGL